MLRKPGLRQPGSLRQGARLLEEMARTGHHFDQVGTPQTLSSTLVEGENGGVVPADDEQGRCHHERQPIPRQVGAATARDDGGEKIRFLGCGLQRDGCTAR